MHAHDRALYFTAGLWIFNACAGPNGWFSLWTGIQAIFAYIAELCGVVVGWIVQKVAFLGVSFGEYLYAKFAVDHLLHIFTETGTWLQFTGIIVSGLFLSYAVFALGYSVWAFWLHTGLSRHVVSVYAVHVFLPLVLAWIVLGMVCFDTVEQGGKDAKENDGNTDHLGLNSNENNKDADKDGEKSSKEGRVHTNNDNLFGDGATPKNIYQGNSAIAGGVAKATEPLLEKSLGVLTMTPSPTRQDNRVTTTPSPPRQDNRGTRTPSPTRQDNRKRKHEQTGDDQNPGNKKRGRSLKAQFEAEMEQDSMEWTSSA